MNEDQHWPIDIQVQDKLVAILIINGCKYSGLRKWLVQQLSPDVAYAYPVMANAAVGMTENGVWSEDHKKTQTSKPNCYKKNDNDKKNSTVGGIIHNVNNEEEAGTMEHVLAMVDSNSNVTKCHNSSSLTQ